MRMRAFVLPVFAALLLLIAALFAGRPERPTAPERDGASQAATDQQPGSLSHDQLKEKARSLNDLLDAQEAGKKKSNVVMLKERTDDVQAVDPTGQAARKRELHRKMVEENTFEKKETGYLNETNRLSAFADSKGVNAFPAGHGENELRLHLARLESGVRTWGATEADPNVNGNVVSYNLGDGITEKFVKRGDSLQYMLLLDRKLETEGDLTVSTPVDTALEGHAGDAISFQDPAGTSQYQLALARVIDSAGRRLDLDLSYENGEVSLTIPQNWLQGAQYPVLIDPTLLMAAPGQLPFPAINDTEDDLRVDVSYDPTNDRYFLCWERFDTGSGFMRIVYTVLDNTATTTIGGVITIGIGADLTHAASDFNVTASQYFVACRNANNAGMIGAFIVNAGGGVPAGVSLVSFDVPDVLRNAPGNTLDDTEPNVVWNSTANEFMVSLSYEWDVGGTDYDVAAATATITANEADWLLIGVLDGGTGKEDKPQIDYNLTSDNYLNVNNFDILGVNPDIHGDVFVHNFSSVTDVVPAATAAVERNPDTAWNSDDDQFGVFFEEAGNIRGQIVDNAGALSGGVFDVAIDAAAEANPTTDYSDANCAYMVCWERAGVGIIEGRMVNNDGTMQSDILNMSPTLAGSANIRPDVVFNSGANAAETFFLAWDSDSAAAFGVEIRFDLVDANEPPTAPTNPVPADGAINVPNTQDLSWDASTDPDGPDGDIVYDVLLDTVNPPVAVVANDLAALTFDPGVLINGQQYWWQVIAKDPFKGQTASAIWTFTVDLGVPPDDVALGTLTQHDFFPGSGPEIVGFIDTDDTMVFRGTVSDPDGGNVQLQVEIELIGVVFDQTTNVFTSPAVASGSVAEVTVPGLADGQYHWQAWAIDPTSQVSANPTPWGGNTDPNDVDFEIDTTGGNNPPADPTAVNPTTDDLTQHDTSAGPAEPVAFIDDDDTMTFKAANVNDPDGDTVAIQAEIKPIAQAFDGTGLAQGAFVTNGNTSEVTVPGLANQQYHWRARLIDDQGATSNWVEWGNNAPGAVDFEIAVVGGNNPPNALTNPPDPIQSDDPGGPAEAAGFIDVDNQMSFRATVSDPDGGNVAIQVERKLVGVAFDGIGLLTGAFVPSGTVSELTSPGIPDGQYHWRARAWDGTAGSAWQPFGGNTDPNDVDFEIDTSGGNLPPNAISSATMEQRDTPGGPAEADPFTDTDNAMSFAGLVSDPNADNCAIKVEIKVVGVPFDGLGLNTGAFVASGSVSEVTVTPLANADYHWRARAFDGAVGGPWTEFNPAAPAVDPTPIDFTINTVGAPPLAPAGLGQLETPAGPPVLVGGAAPGASIVLEGTVNDLDSPAIQMQVEVKPIGTAFDGTTNLSLSAPGAPLSVFQVTVSPGTGNFQWRARGFDGVLFGPWTDFGGNNPNPPMNPADIDFIIRTLGPVGSRGGSKSGCYAESSTCCNVWPAGLALLILLGLAVIRRRMM